MNEIGVRDQPVIGLAKRLEEVFLPSHSDPQNIPKASAALKLLQAVRDESHRFAVTYHRKLRQKRTLASRLDELDGVGPARRKAMLAHFGSMKKIREAAASELAAVEGIGPKLAEQIAEQLAIDLSRPTP